LLLLASKKLVSHVPWDPNDSELEQMCLAFASFTGNVIVLRSGRRQRACAANDFAQTLQPMQRREGHAKSSASVDAIGGGYAAFQKRALTRRKACRRNMHALLGKDSSHVVSGVMKAKVNQCVCIC